MRAYIGHVVKLLLGKNPDSRIHNVRVVTSGIDGGVVDWLSSGAGLTLEDNGFNSLETDVPEDWKSRVEICLSITDYPVMKDALELQKAMLDILSTSDFGRKFSFNLSKVNDEHRRSLVGLLDKLIRLTYDLSSRGRLEFLCSELQENDGGDPELLGNWAVLQAVLQDQYEDLLYTNATQTNHCLLSGARTHNVGIHPDGDGQASFVPGCCEWVSDQIRICSAEGLTYQELQKQTTDFVSWVKRVMQANDLSDGSPESCKACLAAAMLSGRLRSDEKLDLMIGPRNMAKARAMAAKVRR